jgi:dCMP deaminase
MPNIDEDGGGNGTLQTAVARPRPSWTEYFLKLTLEVATRSTCRRARHGALVVRDKTILSTGYNGAPRRMKDCAELGECYRETHKVKAGERYETCRSAHAEMNAIAQAARSGACIEGATIYVTDLPCAICSKLIINAGIVEVVFKNSGRYVSRDSHLILDEAGIHIVEVEG